MPSLLSLILLTLILAGTGSWADVSYVEQIVNSGFGPKKTGARKTTYHVYLKGQRQRVHHEIDASRAQARSLSKQGVRMRGSSILQLDRPSLYEFDPSSQTFVQQELPLAISGISASSAGKRAAGWLADSTY